MESTNTSASPVTLSAAPFDPKEFGQLLKVIGKDTRKRSKDKKVTIYNHRSIGLLPR
jgi:hypothetical protein